MRESRERGRETVAVPCDGTGARALCALCALVQVCVWGASRAAARCAANEAERILLFLLLLPFLYEVLSSVLVVICYRFQFLELEAVPRRRCRPSLLGSPALDRRCTSS